MLIVIVLIVVGMIVYFSFVKKTKCDFCQNEKHDVYSIENKHICKDCLNEKHALGYYRYKRDVLYEDVKEENIEGYKSFFDIVLFETSLQLKGTPNDKSYILTPALVITPTFIMSNIFEDLVFRTKEIAAITVDCHWNNKDIVDGVNGYIVTFYINNILAPYLQTVIYGKQKLFKFNSTLEKETQEKLDKLLSNIIPPLSTGIPISNFKGLKKYVKENEESLTGKLFSDKFKATDFCKTIDKASNYDFKILTDSDNQSDEMTEAVLKTSNYLANEGFTNPIQLLTI